MRMLTYANYLFLKVKTKVYKASVQKTWIWTLKEDIQMANKQMTGAPPQYSLGNANGNHNEIVIRMTKTEKPRSSLG